jgi:hypothetical protein
MHLFMQRMISAFVLAGEADVGACCGGEALLRGPGWCGPSRELVAEYDWSIGSANTAASMTASRNRGYCSRRLREGSTNSEEANSLATQHD